MGALGLERGVKWRSVDGWDGRCGRRALLARLLAARAGRVRVCPAAALDEGGGGAVECGDPEGVDGIRAD